MIHSHSRSARRTTLARAFFAGFLLLAMAGARADCLEGGLGLDPATLSAVFVHPSEPDTLFATQFQGATNGLALLKSCDAGQNWSATALTSDLYSVNSLAVDPTNGEVVIAQTNRGGLVSEDGGITFSEIELPLGDLLFGNDGTLYAYAPPAIQRRLPGQATWTELTPVPSGFSKLLIDPSDNNRLHVGTHYSVDGGTSWQQVLPALVKDLAYSPSDPARMVATHNPIRVSVDGGVNWAPPELEEFSWFESGSFEGRQVIFDAAEPDTIWVSLEGCGLFRSALVPQVERPDGERTVLHLQYRLSAGR